MFVRHQLLVIETGEQLLHEGREVGCLLPHRGDDLPGLNRRLGRRRRTRSEQIEPHTGFRAISPKQNRT